MDFQDQEIYQAILDNDTEQLEILLKSQDVNQRGYDGSSYLHVAIDQGTNDDIVKMLLNKIDISFRDENGDTALDLAITREARQIQWLILNQVCQLIKVGNMEILEHLLKQGWNAWPVDVDEIKDVKENVRIFFRELPAVQKKVYQIHHCIEQNSPDYLKTTLTSKQLAIVCDHSGLPPLQKAVIFQLYDIVEHIVKRFPSTVNVADNMGRTALHYAACSATHKDIYILLKKAGADEKIKDLTHTTPEIFKNNPGLFALSDVQYHLETLQLTHPSGLQFRLSNLNKTEPQRDKNLLMTEYQTTSSLPTIINIHRKKSIKQLAQGQEEQQIQESIKNGLGITTEKEPKLFEETKLYEAIIMNDVIFMKTLLDNGHSTHVRSLEGWSYLHLAVTHRADEMILQLLVDKVDISLHNVDGYTAMDLLLFQMQKHKPIDIFKKEVLKYLFDDDVARLKRLALNGWLHWPPLNKLTDKNALPERSRNFLEHIKYIQKLVKRMHQSVVINNVDALKEIISEYSRGECCRDVLGKDEIITACDRSGIPLFIKTVIFNSVKCFEYLLNIYPQIVSEVDDMGRTAMHYCTDVDSTMYRRLLASELNQNYLDLWGLTASDYLRNPHLLNLETMAKQLIRNTLMEQTAIYKALEANDLEAFNQIFEESEEEFNIKDSLGRSLLHAAVFIRVDLDIFKALVQKVDIGARDINGYTVLDMITIQSYYPEAETEVNNYIKQLAENSDTERLTGLLLSGWNSWPLTKQDAILISLEIGEFFEKLEQTQLKIARIHKAIEEGRLRDLKNLMDRKMLAMAADQTGTFPLQKAVIFWKSDIIQFILSEFPDTINFTDNMGRTALHYAAGSDDEENIFDLLKEAGADDTIKDVAGKTPLYYFENPEEMVINNVRERMLEIAERTRPNDLRSKTSLAPSNAESKSSHVSEEEVHTPPFSRQPFRMYISTDIYFKRDVPPPETVDAKYVAKNLGTALTMALAEIAECRPWDPIEYLAHWLYKYKENLDYNQRQEDLLNEIKREERELQEAEVMKFRRKKEQKRIEAIEEEKRRAKEEEERKQREEEERRRRITEQALAEKAAEKEKEERSIYTEKDENGQTELHKMAGQAGADLLSLLDMNYSLAERDVHNKTPRDIAMEFNLNENVEIIDSYIGNIIEQEKLDILQQLLIDGYGYDKLKAILNQVSTEGLPEVVTEFIKTLPELEEKIAAVFNAVKKGYLRNVALAIERKKLALAKDVLGRSPLHMAVLLEHKDIVEYIVKNFPITVKCRDNWNRTPLHYAMAISDDLVDILLQHGADPDAKDVKNRVTTVFKEDKSEIFQMKAALQEEEHPEEIEPIPEDTVGEIAEKTENSDEKITGQSSDTGGTDSVIQEPTEKTTDSITEGPEGAASDPETTPTDQDDPN